MITKIKYEFSAKIWQHSAPGGWYFVTLPVELSNEIRENLKWQEEGWGRLKASAKIRNSEWNAAIWFDTKHHTYLLPIKAEIRRKEKIELNPAVGLIFSNINGSRGRKKEKHTDFGVLSHRVGERSEISSQLREDVESVVMILEK